MKPPKASFVIPAYNGQAYLAEAIESCLNQTVQAVQVVVVNDGSTDSTRHIAEHYQGKDERVTYLNLGKNVGRSMARNAGIAQATADLLLMLDADDMALPHRVAHTLKFFKANPGVDVLFSKFQVIDEIGSVQGIINAPPFDFKRLKETKLTYIGHSTLSFRKKVFDKVQYTDGDYSKNAIDDWKFEVDAYKAGFKFGAYQKALSQYRIISKPRDEAKILALKEACLS